MTIPTDRGRPGRLVLEDGRIFSGHFFGTSGDYFGEVCFNTSLTGYQEIFSDPSYTGQIVTLTVPHVGNTGVNDHDFESARYHPAAVVMRELSGSVSSHRAQGDLETALQKAGVAILSQVETRDLTLHLRSRGTLQGLVTDDCASDQDLVARVGKAPRLGDEDQVLKVTCPAPYGWTGTLENEPFAYEPEFSVSAQPFSVAVIDYGVKKNILRMLASAGCRVRVFPAKTDAREILSGDFDGLFLSNGPGDPERTTYGVSLVRDCLGRLPIFGICMGHQVLGLALGAKTFKLKFGHRGGNHPVKDLRSGRIEITSQNHGYAVDPEGLPSGVEVTHLNLNDQTVEGMLDASRQAFGIQYHPESAPGPHDSSGLWSWFFKAMTTGRTISAL